MEGQNELNNLNERKVELLKPKLDAVFHSLFRKGNEKITKAIIQAITNEEIGKIIIDSDRYLINRFPEKKMGILDLKAIFANGTICDIEIQLSKRKDTAERFLYYWSKIYSEQLDKGDDYTKLNKVIGIIILDYEFDKTKEIEELSTKWKIKEVNTGEELLLTDVLELFIIELPKAKRLLEKEPNNKLAQWMIFLDNPNEKEVTNIMDDNKEIKEAMEELEEMSKDKELRRIAFLEEKAMRDEISKIEEQRIDLENARKEATRQGIEEGIKQGIEQGIEEGKKEGIKEGEKNKAIEIAKEMIKKGIDLQLIEEVTKLSKEELENIK